MITVASFGWVFPLELCAIIVVALIPKSRFRTEREPPRKVASNEIAFVIGAAIWNFLVLLIVYLPPADLVYSIPPAGVYFLAIWIPLACAYVQFKYTLNSFRSHPRDMPFSLLLGILTSAILLIPTLVVVPDLPSIVISRGGADLFVTLPFTTISEELFFRGLIQPRLESALGMKTGLFLTALISSFSHYPVNVLGPPHESILTATVILFFNLLTPVLLGLIAQRSGNLVGSIIFHLCYDILGFLR